MMEVLIINEVTYFFLNSLNSFLSQKATFSPHIIYSAIFKNQQLVCSLEMYRSDINIRIVPNFLEHSRSGNDYNDDGLLCA